MGGWAKIRILLKSKVITGYRPGRLLCVGEEGNKGVNPDGKKSRGALETLKRETKRRKSS